MKKLSSTEIRQMFLDFFKEKGHAIEPSASLIPKDDPTLLWINSGVATLKKYFDGREIPKNPRIVNAQKSIRTNDIENVGYTSRHHTFFEMLGNFSIGDYFKKEAIEWAWEFLTSERWIGFDEQLLSVTVHPEDEEAYDIWLNHMKLPEERIIRLEENFWDIGVGPSGPNTEIFYDRGEAFGNDPEDPELYPGGENERYIEVWNLVFSEFNHNPDDTYTPLPNKNIDTGLGLERLTAIVQKAPTNFETDLFLPIIQATEKHSNVKYGENKEADASFKIIADHIRTVAFAIGDGALPSNEGRGYILRRLIRRATRFAKHLGIEKPFMHKLVETVGHIMKEHYPEVHDQKEHIETIIRLEEERFHTTLNEGLSMLEQLIARAKKKKEQVISGDEVFKLYDTYGFPKELTEEYVQEHGLAIDEDGFQKEMKKQQERARKAREDVDSMHVQSEVLTTLTNESSFVGYHYLLSETETVVLLKDGKEIDILEESEEGYVILKETPFYAESGGQVADQGILQNDHVKLIVKDVQKGPNGQHIHHVVVKEGTLHKGDSVQAIVNESYRDQIVKNHTATHLLHQALKDVLGTHVSQAGSLVSDRYLRFDFNHFHAITNEEIKQIEERVNEKIWENIPVQITEMSLEEAKEMGATALFGEKYADIVRVVQIDDYSIELCGGCHVQRTSEIGLFKITQEAGIGAGVRRIEAVTSRYAYEKVQKQLMRLQKVASLLQTNELEVDRRLSNLLAEMNELRKTNESLSNQLSRVESKTILTRQKNLHGISFIAEKVKVQDMNQLRTMMDHVKQEIESGLILLAAESKGKVLLVSGMTKDLIDQGFHAGELIREVAKICGGGGGGRPDMAQAGGKEPSKIDEALDYAEQYIERVKNN